MKRMILLLLVLLLLTACSAPEAEPSQPAPETAALQAETEAPAPMPGSEEETPVQKEAAEPAVTESPEREEKEQPLGTDIVVTLDGLDSYLRMTLPAGWTWKEEQDPPYGLKSVLLTAPTDDGFVIRAVYWHSFAMCGTGVSFEEITLPGGIPATLAAEETRDGISRTLILQQDPSCFTLQYSAPQDVIDAHQAELDAMLESLQLGALSHIPPQPVSPTVDK